MPPNSADELHAAIMNVPLGPIAMFNDEERLAYLAGHRDARHAAAELVLSASPPPPSPEGGEGARLSAADYEQVMADHRYLVRRLDVALNGEAGAAKQASLVDIVAQVEREGIRAALRPEGKEEQSSELKMICPACGIDRWQEGCQRADCKFVATSVRRTVTSAALPESAFTRHPNLAWQWVQPDRRSAMFDEQPDGDPHGECAAEIHRLQGVLRDAVELLEIWQSHLGASRAQCDVGGRVTWDRIERVRSAFGVKVPDQRQRFEAWADDQGFPLRKLETSDGYLDLRTQGAWDAWQACSADGVAVPAPTVQRYAGQFHLTPCPTCIRVREGAICSGSCDPNLGADSGVTPSEQSSTNGGA